MKDRIKEKRWGKVGENEEVLSLEGEREREYLKEELAMMKERETRKKQQKEGGGNRSKKAAHLQLAKQGMNSRISLPHSNVKWKTEIK